MGIFRDEVEVNEDLFDTMAREMSGEGELGSTRIEYLSSLISKMLKLPFMRERRNLRRVITVIERAWRFDLQVKESLEGNRSVDDRIYRMCKGAEIIEVACDAIELKSLPWVAFEAMKVAGRIYMHAADDLRLRSYDTNSRELYLDAERCFDRAIAYLQEHESRDPSRERTSPASIDGSEMLRMNRLKQEARDGAHRSWLRSNGNIYE